ncbi:MAG: DUF4167 domain-containing protein [Pseudomonadota bacterium]
MRQGQNLKRGRNQRRKSGGNVNRAMDSSGPDVRIRGTAAQIYDKYIGLSRDAQTAGDRIKAENYLQHAEHYFRIMRAMQPNFSAQSQNEENFGEDNAAQSSGDKRDGDKAETPAAENGAQTPAAEANANGAAPAEDKAAGSDDANGAAPEAEEQKPRRRRRTRRPAAASAEDNADAPAAAPAEETDKAEKAAAAG